MMEPSDPSGPSDLTPAARKALQADLQLWLKYPFGCKQLVEAFDEARARRSRAPSPRRLLTAGAHAQCKGRAADWSACDRTREAMDACIEPAERKRFRGDNACRRWRRLYQSCILESQAPTDCDGRLQRFHKCVVGAVCE